MLFLNESNINKAVTMTDVIDAIDLAYEIYESDQFHMPTRVQIKEKENTLLLMPCLVPDTIATKLVTVFPNNKTVPVINGLVVLNDSETGEVTSLLDGSFLTGLRTGAVGGSAIRHLAPKNTTKLALIGAGTQGFYQVIAACTEREITDIYIHNRTKENVPKFVKKLSGLLDQDIKMHIMDTATEAIENAEVVITSTTSEEPVIPDEPNLLKNKLFIGIGSFQPVMREFPKSLYKLADHILIDTKDAIKETGDLAIPVEKGWIKEQDIQLFSSHVSTNKKVNYSKERSIIFKSTGMALFDVVVANLIYQKAIKKGVGQKLSF